ncbi:hypothetical protein JCM10213_003287 [Rhodosporidiobolus nylandii]
MLQRLKNRFTKKNKTKEQDLAQVQAQGEGGVAAGLAGDAGPSPTSLLVPYRCSLTLLSSTSIRTGAGADAPFALCMSTTDGTVSLFE